MRNFFILLLIAVILEHGGFFLFNGLTSSHTENFFWKNKINFFRLGFGLGWKVPSRNVGTIFLEKYKESSRIKFTDF